MYSDKIDHICAYCFYSEMAKGLTEHIYCTKRKEYRRVSGEICSDYKYDILKRPVRRRALLKTDKKYNFEI